MAETSTILKDQSNTRIVAFVISSLNFQSGPHKNQVVPGGYQ
jgi:hypothetical protein